MKVRRNPNRPHHKYTAQLTESDMELLHDALYVYMNFISGTLDEMPPIMPTDDMEIDIVDGSDGDISEPSNSNLVQAIRSQTYIVIREKRNLLLKAAGGDLTLSKDHL